MSSIETRLQAVVDAAVAYVTAFSDDEDERLSNAVAALPRVVTAAALAALPATARDVVRVAQRLNHPPLDLDAFGPALDAAVRRHVAARKGSAAAPAIVKRCACEREYTAAQWRALRLRGHQADEVETLEYRDCACGSTLAVALVPAAEPPQ